MIENRLISLLKKTKTLTPKFPASNFGKWKSSSSNSLTEPQSKFYCSTLAPIAETSIAGSVNGCGLRSLLQYNLKNFHIRSFRKFSTSTAVNAKGTEGLKLLVTAGPRAQKIVGVWLYVSAAWVYVMVALGGISRLTKSGLSLTDWKFTGSLPLSNDDWLVEFEKYKQSDEYKRENKEMNLDDFKFMYWMEYAHVLWGRSLGVMFGVPFSYFLLKRYITLRLGLMLSGLFALGAGQGLIGWLATKSGLEEPKSEFAEPRVSIYRLAAHMISTFVVYSGLVWTALSVTFPESPAESVAWVQLAAKVKRFVLPVSFIVGVTAISGAFVAENDLALSTYSRMRHGWATRNRHILNVLKIQLQELLENMPTSQLVHQVLSIASLLSIAGLWWWTRKLDIPPGLQHLMVGNIGLTAVQVGLGTASDFSIVEVSLGSHHQAGVLTLVTLAIYLNHIVRRPSPHLLNTLASVTPPAVRRRRRPKPRSVGF